MTTSKLTLKAVMLGMVLFSAPMANAEGTQIDQATQATVIAKLTDLGYEVRKMEMEDGMLEVYAVKDATTYQLYLDGAFNIVKSCSGGSCENAEPVEGTNG
jgi:hypothetical protein